MLGRALSTIYEIVVLCSDGEVALEEIRRGHPDLILLDLRMPRIDGWQFLEMLEAEGLDIPVVVMSAETRRPWPDSPLVRAFYAKTDGLGSLLATCERVLSEGDSPRDR